MRILSMLLLLVSPVLLSMNGCENSNADNQFLITNEADKEEIAIETTDSVAIDSFLTSEQQFEQYKEQIHEFYKERNYELAWSKRGQYFPQASMFINLIRNVDKEGLEPETYNIQKLSEMYETASEDPYAENQDRLRHNLDLALTSTYFRYADQLWKGIIHPEKAGLRWHVVEKEINYVSRLDSILSDNLDENPFRKYQPVHKEYHNLKDVLANYLNIREVGGWPAINLPAKREAIAEGDTLQVVKNLRERLSLTGDLNENSEDSAFTKEVTEAVKRFQKRHGLTQDGIVGGNTLKKLNVPVEEKIRQMKINLERWRWVPDKIGDNYLLVNIPEFKLHVYENNEEIWDMKVVVGKSMTNTPVFNDKIEYVVLNPYWTVPRSIAVNEILPILKRNPGYIHSQNMEIARNYNFDNPISPYNINWNSVTASNFNYTFRQKPGYGNALGTIKFLFPNDYNVYLHDTPQKHLFDKEQRDYSHGCIRIEEPIKLAKYILRKNKDWPDDKIENNVGGNNTYIKLKGEEQLPVYILYFTTWVDKDGVVHFREDIYGHDRELADLMEKHVM